MSISTKFSLRIFFSFPAGDDMTYMFPDLKTCLNGTFVNDGEMKSASKAFIDSAKIENGVMVLR